VLNSGPGMTTNPLIFKSARASRPDGHWNTDDYDVLNDGCAIGRIFHGTVFFGK